MSMLQMQTAIARLCVDPPFRREFLRDPDGALRGYDLTGDERAAVQTIDASAIHDYAQSLLAKRMGLIGKWFPLTVGLLQRSLSAHEYHHLVERYSIEHVPTNEQLGGEWARTEFFVFYGFLCRCVPQLPQRVRYFEDTARFEAANFDLITGEEACQSARRAASEEPGPLAAGDRPRRCRHAKLEEFGYDMTALVPALEAGETPEAAEQRTAVLFVRQKQVPKVWTSVVSEPFRELLALCDGTRSVEEIAEAMAGQYAGAAGAAEIREDVVGILQQLRDAGAIEAA